MLPKNKTQKDYCCRSSPVSCRDSKGGDYVNDLQITENHELALSLFFPTGTEEVLLICLLFSLLFPPLHSLPSSLLSSLFRHILIKTKHSTRAMFLLHAEKSFLSRWSFWNCWQSLQGERWSMMWSPVTAPLWMLGWYPAVLSCWLTPSASRCSPSSKDTKGQWLRTIETSQDAFWSFCPKQNRRANTKVTLQLPHWGFDSTPTFDKVYPEAQ